MTAAQTLRPPARLGLDVTDVRAWGRRLDRTPRLREVAFTAAERAYCSTVSATDPTAWALVWAVKEAAAKLLGTGFDGLGWHGVEVFPGEQSLRVVVHEPSTDRRAPIRLSCLVRREQDHLLVALSTRPAGRAGVWQLALPASGRAHRSAARSAMAREAARLAVSQLTERAEPTLRWRRLATGAPAAQLADGRQISVSLSHTAGRAAAVVALPSEPDQFDQQVWPGEPEMHSGQGAGPRMHTRIQSGTLIFVRSDDRTQRGRPPNPVVPSSAP